MKYNYSKRAFACVLTLALLLPCLSAVPAVATDVTDTVSVTAAPSGAVELFKWVANTKASSNPETPSALENMEKIQDNLVRATGWETNSTARAKTNFIHDLKVQGATGTERKIFYYIRDYSSRNDASGTFGLPRKSVGGGVFEFRATEGLELRIAALDSVDTQGFEAVNLNLTFGLVPARYAIPVHALDKFDVRVSLDGETWLEDTVGLRSWELLGQAATTDDKMMFVYSLETENLLNIDGLKSGDTIVDVMIRPNGEHYFTNNGYFAVADITLNGYTSRETWETVVPNERNDLLDIGEQTMREIVLAREYAIADTAWTSDVPVYTDSVSGTDYTGSSGGTNIKEFIPGIEYHGPMYSRAMDNPYELFRESVKDGIYIGGRTTGVADGMDCTNYNYDAYSLVSRSYSWRLFETQSDNALVRLGDVKAEKCAVFTNLDIVNLNDAETMYESYALVKPGDVMTTYTNLGGIHHRVATHDAVVVRKADGTIDPDKSYVPVIEQRGTLRYFFEAPDGSVVYWDLQTKEELEERMAFSPDYKLLFGANCYRNSWTFAEMYNSYYVAWTLKEYMSGKVENVDVQMLLHPTDYQDMTKGFTGTIGTDYHIIAYGVRLEDLDRGTVLFEDTIYPRTQKEYAVSYTSDKLNEVLAGLTDGNYRVNLFAQAGPVTQVGADRPITTESLEFTVSGKAPVEEVFLEYAATDLAKDQSVEVYVKSSAVAEAADVTIKYDTDLLSFVEGGPAAAGMKSVTCDGGEVHILCANSTGGIQIAKLTFAAKKEGVSVADAVTIKNASVFTTIGGSTIKASGARDVCPAEGFKDVAEDAWYHDAVDFVLDKGIMAGYDASTFAPNDKLSRAMVVQVLYNKQGQPAVSGAHKFHDVKSGDWFSNAVAWSAGNGVVGGFDDGRFAPNQDVTIEEVAVILWNYAGKPAFTATANSVGTHSSWATNALSWAVENGILNNISYSTVTGAATRAQTAQMMMNYLEK